MIDRLLGLVFAFVVFTTQRVPMQNIGIKIAKVAYDIVGNIKAAKAKSSDGGKEITKAERDGIIWEGIGDLVALLESAFPVKG